MATASLIDARATAYHLAVARLHTARARLAQAEQALTFLRRKADSRPVATWQDRVAQAERDLTRAVLAHQVAERAVERATERFVRAYLG